MYFINKKKGFTLVEMLAVVVILALLIGIAIPIVSRIITASRKNTFLSSYDTLATQIRSDIMLKDIKECDDANASTACTLDTKNNYSYQNLKLKIEKGHAAAAGGSALCTDDKHYAVTLTADSTSIDVSGTDDCPVTDECTGKYIIKVCFDADGGVTKQ